MCVCECVRLGRGHALCEGTDGRDRGSKVTANGGGVGEEGAADWAFMTKLLLVTLILKYRVLYTKLQGEKASV